MDYLVEPRTCCAARCLRRRDVCALYRKGNRGIIVLEEENPATVSHLLDGIYSFTYSARLTLDLSYSEDLTLVVDVAHRSHHPR